MEEKREKAFKVANIFGDGMILQRNKPIKIWGYTEAGEKVILTLENKSYETLSSVEGEWNITIDPMQAGGPYEIELRTSNHTLSIKNILFGDVWLCSGQSNMELPIARVMERYRDEVNCYQNDEIRMFRVAMAYDFNTPREEIEQGAWFSINPKDVERFTAVGYFFAKALYEKYQVPIGLIDTSVGGSRLECWLSEEELLQYPDAVEEIRTWQDIEQVNQMMRENEEMIGEWFDRLEKLDRGFKEIPNWYSETYLMDEWRSIQVPGEWKHQGIHLSAGSVWFKKEIDLDESLLKKQARILLGTIVDSDRVYINGIEVGRTEYQYPPRIYDIPAGVLRAGKNTITIRAVENSSTGGFTLEKFYGLEFGDEKVDLSGEWLYKVGAEIEPLIPQIFPQFKALGLYNAMIHPLINTEIKGVIWYQGESNADKANLYKERFENLIISWRKLWKNETLPFLYAQLTSYGEVASIPVESCWAELREAQLQALELPYTAMAVITDIGEWNDLHPLNKKDVGERLALAAEVIAYGEEHEYSGPIAKSAKVLEGKVIVDFKHLGSGLAVKNGEDLRDFSISHDNQHFIWAEAKIQGNNVVIWNEAITDPVAIRYGWSDSPIYANLCNREGLMASPFRIVCGRK